MPPLASRANIQDHPQTQEAANLNHYYNCTRSDHRPRHRKKTLKELFDDSEAKTAAAMDDETKPLSGPKKKIAVDIEKLSTMLESQLKFTYHRRKAKTIAKAHSEAVFKLGEENGHYYDAVQSQARELVRRKVFPAWKIQREIDTEAGGMNYEAVQGLRRIEGCDKHEQGFFSSSTLRCTAKKLEEHAFDKGMGFTTEETPRGTICRW